MSSLSRTIAAKLRSPVAVLYGGTAAEREVSLNSGRDCYEALCRSGVDAVLVDTRDDWMLQLRDEGLEHSFIALHGPGGEDGTIQGALESMAISYTGSGVLASALAMDKWRCKQLWQGLGMATPDSICLAADSDWSAVLERLAGKAVVKPAHEGSSLGMTVADSPELLQQAYEIAVAYDKLVFAERWIEGGEYTVSIVGERVLPVIKLETDRGFYDFDAKYLSDDTRYLMPCGLAVDAEKVLIDLSLRAYQSVGCQGWGRVDLLQDDEGEFQLLEVNTVPGMTDHSLVPMAASAAGMSYEDLVLQILAASLQLDVIGGDLDGH